MWKQYKDDYENIEVPSSLKNETLQKMNAMSKKKKSIFSSWKIIVVASCAVVLAFVGYQWFTPETYTKFVEGETLKEVSIEEGDLVFEENAGNGHYFGDTSESNKKKASEDEFETAIGKSLPSIHFDEFTETDKSWYIDNSSEEDMKMGIAIYSFTNNKEKINVTISTNKETEKTNSSIKEVEKSNSVIAGKDVNIYYHEVLSNTTYTAFISEDSFIYEVTMQGVNQEEFVEYLINFINLI
ncbi:MAG: hypothetical protein ACK5LC_11130 [Coprobacillaceae bacterium]